MENLENILESILFTNGDAVDISDITSKIDVTKAEINKAVNKLKNKYGENSGIVLLTFNNKLQLASSGKYANEVSLVLNPIRQRNLSKATLETASIVAYKQPVTRMEIEEIRGVSSDYAINILLEHNLIEIVGRKDTVGKPVLFGTTDEFLKRFNLSSLDELPDYNTLLEKVRVIENKDDRLYNHFEVKSEGENEEEQVAVSEEKLDPVIGEKYDEDFKPEQTEKSDFDEEITEYKTETEPEKEVQEKSEKAEEERDKEDENNSLEDNEDDLLENNHNDDLDDLDDDDDDDDFDDNDDDDDDDDFDDDEYDDDDDDDDDFV